MSVVRASGWVEFGGRVVVLKYFGGGPGNQAELFGSRMMRVSVWVGVLTVSILD